MEVEPKQIQNYQRVDGMEPFTDWLNDLRDVKARAIIRKRLERVQLGNLGNHRFVGKNVWELKIDYAGGYRIYFGQVGLELILLLCGGDKSTQEDDILIAQTYWREYEQRQNSD
jgi:putative addiction module killer protein